MRAVVIAVMTCPLWGGFLVIAWQVRKLIRAVMEARTMPARNDR